MQEENKVTNQPNQPDMTRTQNDQKGQSEAFSATDVSMDFVEEVQHHDHSDYETDWSKYDMADTDQKTADDKDIDFSKVSAIQEEIVKLKKKRNQRNNHYARMRNKLKGELRKDRNARLVMWGAEFEYQIGKRSPVLKKLLPYLDRDLQKKIIWHIFAEITIGPKIIAILKDYTKDINAGLPDDLAPYAE